MKTYLAEVLGTFLLVFIGTASVVTGGFGGALPLGQEGIGLAFGIGLIAAAYAIGPISGCHVNPAVSLGALVAGRMSAGDFITYVIAQVAGAIVGALVLYIIMTGKASGWTGGMGTNGWGPGYLGEYNTLSALIFEIVATFIFVVVILGVTHKLALGHFAGLAIGLTLVMIHIVGINVTGVSVNPARSIGPALFAGGQALSQLWLFIVAPFVGAALAGFVFKAGILYGEDT